ncbi:tRNA (adenosine(37)-N6)-threonylcarbamoyltransferase complex dimerization subunit type 1 TsaB [Andreprevotia chitinilytica]|uniref:tRNA (adenosine(37)-N6)-threonylcarbamoyltransferase complex dimerization subunit type 1 TsaB n=1 Tax=Andreprevotia chitinilytica TaxID=396808 RepID=UPI000554430E|nr:tRNA (adenosine(37)-N6)-threonylcarbamoyltransferase complex dimerization subunit type 1 TsaB [Andreprevotia chitinilytica]
MAFLALDTSTEHLSLALTTPTGIVARDWHVGQRHAEHSLPYLEALLIETGIAREQIEGVAYGMGPGSFTGLRIGCGIAQGLAFGLGVPLIGICTLEALAAQVDGDRAYVCLDARMNQVYVAAYERDGSRWHEVIPPTLADPDAVPLPDTDGWIGLGSGFAAYGDALTGHLGAHLASTLPDRFPRAVEILTLALPRFAAGEALAPHDAPLLYLRDKVALKTHERPKK